jgi:DUF971 family protein
MVKAVNPHTPYITVKSNRGYMATLVTKLNYHKISKILDVHFCDVKSNLFIAQLSAEFLRTQSPSAEVQGHGAEQKKLVANKRQVDITHITPVGHYAIKITFDDGHDSGLFSWQYLEFLYLNQPRLWAEYLQQLTSHNASREQVIPIKIT